MEKCGTKFGNNEEGNEKEVTHITKKIKQSARKDKIRHRKEALEQGTQMKEKWQGIKQQKKTIPTELY